MRRKTFDAILTTGGLIVAVLLFIVGALGLVASNFVDDQVRTQLAAQKIYFPEAGSPALTSNPEIKKYVTPYAGQQVLTGEQARVFAEHYIGVHVRETANGRTYSEVSGEFIAKLRANPNDPALAELGQQRQTLFMGETLKGLLLNAYAFGKMGQIAYVAGITAFIGGGLMLILSALGYWHLRRTSPEVEVLSKLVDVRVPAQAAV